MRIPIAGLAALAATVAVCTETQAQPAGPPATGTSTIADLPPKSLEEAKAPDAPPPPRSASDWTRRLGYRPSAPLPGRTGSDLLRKAPGVFVSEDGGEGMAQLVQSRGFDAVHGRSLQITAGGIPVNEVSNLNAQGYADLHFLIPEIVQQMRTRGGAFDPQQGDFALAGSVDMDLGLERRGVMGRFSYGRFDSMRGMAAWGPAGHPSETFAAVDFGTSDGYGAARNWNRGSAIGQALIRPADGLSIRLLGSAYSAQFHSPGVLRTDDLDSGRAKPFDTYDEQQGGSSTRQQALVELRWTADEDSHASLTTYLVRRGLRLRENRTGFVSDRLGDHTIQDQGTTTIGGSATFHRTLVKDRLLGDFGVSWRHDVAEQTQQRAQYTDLVPYARDVDNREHLTDIGLHADFEVRISETVRARAGLRVDSLSGSIDETLGNDGAGDKHETFGFHVGPKATVEALVIPELRFFASYGNGFRSPRPVSVIDNAESPLTVVHGGEIGGHLDLGPALRAAAFGFVSYISDDTGSPHGGQLALFRDATLSGGATLVLETCPWPWLAASLSASFARTALSSSGNAVPYVSPWMMRLDIEAHREVGKAGDQPVSLFGAIGAAALGARPLPAATTGQSAFTLEASAGVEVGAITISVEAFNPFDSRWRDNELLYVSDFNPMDSESGVAMRHVVTGRPFTVQATLGVHY